jgi:hypothetical protein
VENNGVAGTCRPAKLAVTCISRATEPRALSLLRSIDKVACKQTGESEQPTA